MISGVFPVPRIYAFSASDLFAETKSVWIVTNDNERQNLCSERPTFPVISIA